MKRSWGLCRHKAKSINATPATKPACVTTDSTRCRAQGLERQLLQYFSTSRLSMATSSSVALQVRTSRDSTAVSEAILFPVAPPPSSSHHPGQGKVVPPSTTSSQLSASVLQSSLSSAEMWRTKKGMSLTSPFREIADCRLLNNRYMNNVDRTYKDGNDREESFNRVSADINTLWQSCCRAHSDIVQVTASTADNAAIVPDRVLFVVLHSATQQKRPVGGVLTDIYRRIVQAVESHHAQHSALRIIPICVGCTAPSEVSCLDYAHGGMYTLNAVLQCLEDLPPHPSMQRRAMVFSEGFQFPRLVTSMHAGGSRSRGQRAPHHVVEVFPAVISGSLSVKEADAFARYATCSFMR